jgi:hypothetical protein
MPCMSGGPSISEEGYLSRMLCQACRHLTVEQMQEIKVVGERENLYVWHAKHLLRDYLDSKNNTERERHYNEMKRIGYELVMKNGRIIMEFMAHETLDGQQNDDKMD